MRAGGHGRVLTAPAMQAHNTFGRADAVKPEKLDGIRIDGDAIKVTLPAKCVAVLEIG